MQIRLQFLSVFDFLESECMKKSITLLVLAYNEEKYLKDTVDTCDAVAREMFDDYEILIGNDGSTDRTREITEHLTKESSKIKVFHNKKNMGVGYTYKRGIQLAQKQYLLWLPGDNEVTADDIRRMLKYLGKADLVISYIVDPTIRPLYRRIMSTVFTAVVRNLLGLNLNSFLGMILCKTKLLQSLKFSTNSSCLMAEVMVKLIKTGHTYRQVPIHMRKKQMSINIIRPKNISGIFKTIIKLFIMFQIRKGKNISK